MCRSTAASYVVTPYAERIPTAQQWLHEAGMSAAAVAPEVSVYVAIEPTGTSRRVSEAEFDQIQARLYEGGLQVPARAITQRTR